MDDSFRIHKNIRDLCVFARQNLGADPPFSKIDLISCQNVLIYFGHELQRQVISVFHYALQPNGFILLGSAESIGGLTELFTAADRRTPALPQDAADGPARVEIFLTHDAGGNHRAHARTRDARSAAAEHRKDGRPHSP